MERFSKLLCFFLLSVLTFHGSIQKVYGIRTLQPYSFWRSSSHKKATMGFLTLNSKLNIQKCDKRYTPFSLNSKFLLQTENHQSQFKGESLKAKDNFGFLPLQCDVKKSSSLSATTLETETIPFSIKTKKDIRVVYSNTIFNSQRLLERPKQKQKDKINDVDIGTRTQQKQNILIVVDDETKQNTDTDKGFNLLIFNDPVNTREYVANCLTSICDLSDDKAYEVMMTAHKNGFAVVGQYKKETCDNYCERLQTAGILADVEAVD